MSAYSRTDRSTQKLLTGTTKRINELVQINTDGNLAEFARLLDVDYSAAKNWTHGVSFPNAGTLISMRTQLDVDLNWLLTGEATE